MMKLIVDFRSFAKRLKRKELFRSMASFPAFIQGVSRFVDITAGGDFLGLCDQKNAYKHVSDFGRLRCYDRFET